MTVAKRLLIRAFVDSVAWHKWWHCHRLAERSFTIDGRQFHICARCTGLVIGLLISPALFPWRAGMSAWFFLFLSFLLADTVTQFVGWRESTNIVRFATGFLVAACGPSVVLAIGGI